MSYLNILRVPDCITVQTADSLVSLQRSADGRWDAPGVQVVTRPEFDRVTVQVTADTQPLQRVHLRWNGDVGSDLRVLGDHWERGYGDLEWRGIVPERVMPWYFLTAGPDGTHGYGVKTQAASLCWWRVDPAGISLWLDIRNGGSPVELGHRTLHAADVVTRAGSADETPFQASRAFCRQLCDKPRLPSHPVYGSNNWYYAYGVSSHARIIEDTRLLMDYAPDGGNSPYMVIDAGWQARATVRPGHNDAACGSPWDRGNADFPDMSGLAESMRRLGSRPGIWIRPLAGAPDDPAAIRLPIERARDSSAKIAILDPSIPEVLERVAADFRRLHDWGYQLIKHDWTTCDILGRWGFDLNSQLTNPGWRFNDPTRTTAEIILDLFRAIRRGADDSIVIGCNTIGHLGAGIFDLQRTGDDTSGQEWERTRKMGINTLAFRMCQHDAFFAADADCVGLTRHVPWELNRQWLDVLARSGDAAVRLRRPDAVGPEQANALRRAFAHASRPQPPGEPLDWLNTTCPRTWRLNGERVQFDWYASDGIALCDAHAPDGRLRRQRYAACVPSARCSTPSPARAAIPSFPGQSHAYTVPFLRLAAAWFGLYV